MDSNFLMVFPDMILVLLLLMLNYRYGILQHLVQEVLVTSATKVCTYNFVPMFPSNMVHLIILAPSCHSVNHAQNKRQSF